MTSALSEATSEKLQRKYELYSDNSEYRLMVGLNRLIAQYQLHHISNILYIIVFISTSFNVVIKYQLNQVTAPAIAFL